MNIAFYSITPLRHQKEATTITLLELAKELKRKEHNVIIITERAKETPRFQELQGIPVHRPYHIPFVGRIISPPLALRKIQRELNIRFDVIHGFSATPLFVLSSFLFKVFSPQTKIVHTLKSYSRRPTDRYLFALLNLVDYVTV